MPPPKPAPKKKVCKLVPTSTYKEPDAGLTAWEDFEKHYEAKPRPAKKIDPGIGETGVNG